MLRNFSARGVGEWMRLRWMSRRLEEQYVEDCQVAASRMC